MATRFYCADDRFPRLQRETGPYDNGGRLNRAQPGEPGSDVAFQLWDGERRNSPPAERC
jgi:hypothetical protein